MDNASAVPLYKQVKDDILDKTHSGYYKVGSKLPSQEKLSEMYGVSIITIRSAITELVEEKVLIKKQGKGTFVLRKPFRRAFTQSVTSFSEVCKMNNMKASAKVLRCDIEESPDENILKKLKLSLDSKVIYIERLRFADDIPVVIETTCFPMKYAFLLECDLENGSLFQSIRDNMENIRMVVHPGTRTIKISRADTRSAKLLELKKGAPVLTFDGMVYNEYDDSPSHTTHHIGYSDKFDFSFYV